MNLILYNEVKDLSSLCWEIHNVHQDEKDFYKSFKRVLIFYFLLVAIKFVSIFHYSYNFNYRPKELHQGVSTIIYNYRFVRIVDVLNYDIFTLHGEL